MLKSLLITKFSIDRWENIEYCAYMLCLSTSFTKYIYPFVIFIFWCSMTEVSANVKSEK